MPRPEHPAAEGIMRCLRCSLEYGPEQHYCDRCGRALSRPLGSPKHRGKDTSSYAGGTFLYTTSSPPSAPVVASPGPQAVAVADRTSLLSLPGEAQTPDLYRRIYMSLNPPRNARQFVIGVTSAISGEGRSTVAYSLATTLAGDLDTRVTLVEADLEHPALAQRLQLPSAPGLAELLREQCRLDEVMRAVADNLSVVVAGMVGREVGRLIRRLPALDPFRDPRSPSGVVVLDLPPVMNHGFGALAAGAVDVAVLVVRAGVTPIGIVRDALARFEGSPPQGIVLNAPRTSLPAWWPT